MNKYKCPRDKVQCIKLCAKAVVEIFKSGSPEDLPGADDFFPIMVLVLKEANPDKLHSNIKYLQNYTHPDNLSGEVGYLLTQFMSAVVFLENADAAALTISPIEFERAIQRCKDMSSQQMQQALDRGLKAGTRSKSSSQEPALACDTKKKTSVVELRPIIPKLSIRDVKKERGIGPAWGIGSR